MLHRECCGPRLCKGWMSSLRAILVSLDQADIFQAESRATVNIAPCTVAALAEMGLVSSCLILTALGLWVINVMCVGIKEHGGSVGQCTQQNDHNSPLPINSQHTQISLCRGLVLGNMICSLSNSKEDGGVQRADARSLGVWFGEIKGCVSVIYVYWEVIPLGSHYIHGVSSNTSDHDGIFLHVVVELA